MQSLLKTIQSVLRTPPHMLQVTHLINRLIVLLVKSKTPENSRFGFALHSKTSKYSVSHHIP